VFSKKGSSQAQLLITYVTPCDFQRETEQLGREVTWPYAEEKKKSACFKGKATSKKEHFQK
jgi:hypothetical protein